MLLFSTDNTQIVSGYELEKNDNIITPEVLSEFKEYFLTKMKD